MEESNFDFRYVRLYDLDIPREKWLSYLHTVATDQMPHSVASDLGLHCLPVTLLGVSRLKWVKGPFLTWFHMHEGPVSLNDASLLTQGRFFFDGALMFIVE